MKTTFSNIKVIPVERLVALVLESIKAQIACDNIEERIAIGKDYLAKIEDWNE